MFYSREFFCISETLKYKYLWQANPSAVTIHASMFGPVVAECLKDGNTPVRLAAERCALHAFQLTKGIALLPSDHFAACIFCICQGVDFAI